MSGDGGPWHGRRGRAHAGPHPDGLSVWAAGERGLVKQVRLVVKQELGLRKGSHFSQFYWFEGKATG